MSTDSSATPTIVSPRPQQHPIFSTQHSYFLPPTPPPQTPPPSRTSPKRPSISASAAMNWLSHKSSNSIASLRGRTNSLNKDQMPSIQGLRISEPIPLTDDSGVMYSRGPKQQQQQQLHAIARPLGHGAEVVATPAEALERPAARIASPPPNNNTNASAGRRAGDLPPIPQSPPGGLRSSKSSPHLKSPTFHSRTTSEYSNTALRSPPPPPVRSPLRGPSVIPPLTPFPTPPAQPLNIPSEGSAFAVPPVAPQSKFNAVLLSSNLDSKSFLSNKRSQVIVTLETSTEVFKTTLSTLTSRPSYAAAWFESILKGAAEESIEEEREEEVEEPASTTSSVPPSPFTRVFQDHLTSQGLRPNIPSYREIHLFMDRPSAPYPHVLNYLRSPVESTSLPRAIQFGEAPNPTSAHDAMKVDALLELRDEAAYLGLEGLLQLCELELRRWYIASRRYSSQQHKPTQSTSTAATTTVASRPTSASSQRASVPPATNTTTSSAPQPLRPLRKAASHRILSPSAVPESINEDDGDVLRSAAPWSEFGTRNRRRPSSISEDESSSGVYESSANEDSAVAAAAIQAGPRTASPETITRATAAGHLRSISTSAIPLGMSTSASHHILIPPNRALPDVPSSTSSSALSTPTNAPAPLAPSVGLGLRTRNKTRSRSNSRSEGVSRPTIIPPPNITVSGRGGADRHQRGNSFLPSLMSPSTPKTAGSSSNWI
ncbi:hypothetical protein FRC04_008852 [Tulasnella sp. 424]|nr:hypothetical protein FRC04_008852 [Tulasnella sp. 424]KAG8973754.1 hypothetical protein FRC05_008173 [Tulasnella sp. 425]